MRGLVCDPRVHGGILSSNTCSLGFKQRGRGGIWMVTLFKTLSKVEMAFRNEKQSLGCLKDSWSFSHFKKILAPWKGFFALWISRCEIFAQLCEVCLQTAITFSFQIQITYYLKLWIPDFPSFKKTYRMNNLCSRKCSKNVSNSSKIRCSCNISVQLCIVVFK